MLSPPVFFPGSWYALGITFRVVIRSPASDLGPPPRVLYPRGVGVTESTTLYTGRLRVATHGYFGRLLFHAHCHCRALLPFEECGTCDISAFDGLYLAIFWMLNTAFYWHWPTSWAHIPRRLSHLWLRTSWSRTGLFLFTFGVIPGLE